MDALGFVALIVVLWFWLSNRGSSAATNTTTSSGASTVGQVLGSVGSAALAAVAGAGSGGAVDNSSLPVADGSGTGFNGLDNFMQGIFQYEGGQPANINVRNSNPGNLRAAPGMTGTSGGYATFADIGDGWDALQNYIQTNAAQNPQWDFYDFFQNYLGQSQGGPAVTNQGDSNAYAEYVAKYLGVDPTQPVSQTIYGS